MINRLINLLKKSQPVFLDTSCFIYSFEKHKDYEPLTKNVFNAISDGEISTITSVLSTGEVLIKLFKEKNYELINVYHGIFTQTQKLSVSSPSYVTSVSAAKIAAENNFKLIDSLQLAIAQETGCKSFLTNDKQLAKFDGLKIFLLDQFI